MKINVITALSTLHIYGIKKLNIFINDRANTKIRK